MKAAGLWAWGLQAMAGIVLFLSASVPLSAHNCSSQSDCEDTAGYLTAVSVVGGVIAIVSGLLGASVASTSGTPPPGGGEAPGAVPRGPSGRPLIDPDTNEPLVVQDGTYEGGEIGQVWSPFGGWVDPETAAQHVRERQAELAGRQREIDQFNRETDRQSAERERQAESDADAEARSRAEQQARQDRLAELQRRGDGLIARVDDPARAQELQDFLDRHRDDPDALERAVGAIRTQTFEADQQRTMGEAESAQAEGDAYQRSEGVASKIETAARAGIAATGGAMLAAGAATAGAVGAAAAATGAIGGAGAGGESAARGDSFVAAAANVAAGAAVGAAEGAMAVGAQATAGAARAGIKIVGGGAADFADHLRRTGDVRGAAVQGAIGAVFGAGDGVMPGGVAGTVADVGAAALEGGLRASAGGGDFSEGAQAGATNWVVGRAGSGAASQAARGASGTGFGGPRTSGEAAPPTPGDSGEELGSLAGGLGGPVRPAAETTARPPTEATGTKPAPRRDHTDLEAFIREQEQKGGSTELEVGDANDPRATPGYGEDTKIQQGRGASAEETNRREVWIREDGTRVREPNAEDSLGPAESRIRIDPDTGEARVVHGPKVPDSHKAGAEARLLDKNQDRIQQTLVEERAKNTRIRAQQELEAARAKLREAEARVQEADDRLNATPEDSDDYIPKYGERADARGEKTMAERNELEATMRAMDAEEGIDPDRPRWQDDELGAGGGPTNKFGSQTDALGRFDLDADARLDPLNRYETGEVIPGFVPQVRQLDCSIAVMTRETGLNYDDVFHNMKDYLSEHRDASGNLQYGGLPPANLEPAMQRLGIAGDRVSDVVTSGGERAMAQRLLGGERMITGMWAKGPDGTRTPGHAIIIDGIQKNTRPDGSTQWVFRGIDPARGRIEIPADEARSALGNFQHARFIKHRVHGASGTP